MTKHSKSFFDRLAGNFSDDEEEEAEIKKISKPEKIIKKELEENNWLEEDTGGQLTVDMYQKPNEIVIKAMIAGVKPEDLDISISEDMVTIKGKREKIKEVSEENYYYQELYWGSFSRSILLPQEVDKENIDASIKNGIMVIRLPKISRDKVQKIKIKSE